MCLPLLAAERPLHLDQTLLRQNDTQFVTLICHFNSHLISVQTERGWSSCFPGAKLGSAFRINKTVSMSPNDTGSPCARPARCSGTKPSSRVNPKGCENFGWTSRRQKLDANKEFYSERDKYAKVKPDQLARPIGCNTQSFRICHENVNEEKLQMKIWNWHFSCSNVPNALSICASLLGAKGNRDTSVQLCPTVSNRTTLSFQWHLTPWICFSARARSSHHGRIWSTSDFLTSCTAPPFWHRSKKHIHRLIWQDLVKHANFFKPTFFWS